MRCCYTSFHCQGLRPFVFLAAGSKDSRSYSKPSSNRWPCLVYTCLWSMASAQAAAAALTVCVGKGGGQRRQERLTPEKENPMHVPPIGPKGSGECPPTICPPCPPYFYIYTRSHQSCRSRLRDPSNVPPPQTPSIMPVAASLSLYRQSPSRTMSAVSMVYKEDLAIARSTTKIQDMHPQSKKEEEKSRGMSKWMAAAANDQGTSACTNIYL